MNNTLWNLPMYLNSSKNYLNLTDKSLKPKRLNLYNFDDNVFTIARDMLKVLREESRINLVTDVTGGRVALSYALSQAAGLVLQLLKQYKNREDIEIKCFIKPKGRTYLEFHLNQFTELPSMKKLRILEKVEEYDTQEEIANDPGISVNLSTISRHLQDLKMYGYVEENLDNIVQSVKGYQVLELFNMLDNII